jgi:site-specific DNA-methyltransferase (adenine-specific)
MEKKKPSYSLHHKDALQALLAIETSSVDFVFADPPYFLSNDGFSVKSGKAVSVNKGDWDRSGGLSSDLNFHRTWIRECLRILKPNGTIAISGTYHSIYLCGFVLQELGCRIINDIVWFKPNGAPALAGRNFTASHETVLWASKSRVAKHTFNYSASKAWVDPKDKLLNPGKQMRSVWSISTTPKSEKSFGSHPTQKPLELMMRLIAMCSVEGDTVLDPFCGSGTTGVASVSMGRNFVGIDLDETYLEIAKRRIEEKLEVN